MRSTTPPRFISNSLAYRALTTAPSIKRSARALVVAFFTLVIVLLFTPWQQTAMGDGRVMAFAPGDRVQLITANIDGRVARWYVREGDKVKEGDLLAKMADNDPEILNRLQSEREALVRQIRALEVQVRFTGRDLERQKRLFNDGIASELTFEQAQMARARAQRELANAEGQLAQLEVRIARQMTLEVRAPKDGVVQKIFVAENNSIVKSADVIAQLVPSTTERTIEIVVNGRDLPFIRKGQEVRLQFEGWPILQFAGLPQLSVGTFTGSVMLIDPSDDGAGRFRVLVSKTNNGIWPSSELLRQGVRARGWIQMNEVPLWFEVWRLINDLPPFEAPLDEKSAKGPNQPAKDDSKKK